VVTNEEVEIRYVIPTTPHSEHVRFCHLRKDYFRQVPQAQFVSEAPEDHQAHDIRRILETIEECPCAFIKDTAAVTTTEPAIAECGAIRAFRGGSRLTVWAPHTPPPLTRSSVQAQPWETKVA
jgi:hypothetical protein